MITVTATRTYTSDCCFIDNGCPRFFGGGMVRGVGWGPIVHEIVMRKNTLVGSSDCERTHAFNSDTVGRVIITIVSECRNTDYIGHVRPKSGKCIRFAFIKSVNLVVPRRSRRAVADELVLPTRPPQRRFRTFELGFTIKQ